jgi:MFS family permease
MRRRATTARPLVAMVLVATTGVLPGFLTGAVGVQLREELGFAESGLGVAVSTSFLAAAVCSALFGRWAERLGPARSMRLSSTLSALSMLAVAAGARSLRSLTALLLMGGVANAMSQPATNLFVSRVFPSHRQGVAFAIKQSAIPGATLLGGLAVPLFAVTVGWRWAFVAGAALAVLGGILTPRPAPTATSRAAATASGSGGANGRDQPLATLIVLGTGVGFGALAAASLGSFSTSAFEAASFSEAGAGLLAAAGSLLVIAVRLWLGAWADRRDRHDLLPTVVALVLVGAAGWLAMATMRPVTLLAGAALAYSCGWGWPGLFNLAVAQANPRAPAAASGVTQTGTYLGVAAGPFVFGTLAEHAGYGWAWLFAASGAVASGVCLSAGRRLAGAPPVRTR